MPVRLPEGQQIIVSYRKLPAEYQMPAMEVATDHYNIGFVTSGDRRTITPTGSYRYHAGEVSMMPPFLYHRTLSESSAPYEGYLIKFTPEFIQPFWEKIGKQIFDELYEEKVCHFSENTQLFIQDLFEQMWQEYKKDTPYKEVILQGMLFRLFTSIWENRQETDGNCTARFLSPLSRPVINAIYRIEKDYASHLSLEKVAEEAGFSTSHFSRVFRTQLGMSFSDYVCNVRLQHVKEQLLRTDKSIMEIALDCGYCHGDYLAAQFRQKTGMTPTEFRKNFFHL
ncbi:MAG: helix-turn-helix domain-containing protein [Lachnospiraceae bacterium]|nr:helix-turn-helix domain-containing protein [Lachnospiraceae bacterium]